MKLPAAPVGGISARLRQAAGYSGEGKQKKDHHPAYPLGKTLDSIMLFKTASTWSFKNSH
jgi:hypothetical protein